MLTGARRDWAGLVCVLMLAVVISTLYPAGRGEGKAAVIPGELPEYADLQAAIEAAYAKGNTIHLQKKGISHAECKITWDF